MAVFPVEVARAPIIVDRVSDVVLCDGSGRAQEIASKMDLWSPAKARLRGANIWQKAVYEPDAPYEYIKMESCYDGESLKKLRGWNANLITSPIPVSFIPKR